MQPQKVNMFYLLELLTEYSDEDHILSANEILELMREKYGIKLERRAVYSYVNTLMFLGCDISTYDDNGKGYYLKTGYFDEKEVRLLIHGLYLNPECGKGDVSGLIGKLQKFLSVYKRASYDGTIGRKGVSAVSYDTAELLIRAAEEGKRVSFGYMEHGFENGHLCSYEQRREAAAHDILIREGAFSIEYTDDSGEMHRIGTDKMKDVRLLDGASEERRKESESAAVTVKCREYILNELINDFGDKAHILTHKNNSFTAVLETDRESFEQWALKHIEHCEVIEPKSMRDRLISAIRESGYFNEACNT